MTAGTESPVLVLASASPRRRELLERIGIHVEVVPANVDETPALREDPLVYVARIAAAKAAVVRRSDRWVLAADTAVVVDGTILGKASTGQEAAAMLRQLRGRSHQVMTAFVVGRPSHNMSEGADHSGKAGIDGESASHLEVVTSEVQMVALDEPTIANYVSCGEWHGKAGAYAIQGVAAAFVSSVHGSVTNIIGLPLAEVLAALRKLGGPCANFRRGVPA